MEEEMSSLKKNHTWELVNQPLGQKLVSCKWLYKIKKGIEGVHKPRYKARLVARGFTQRSGIDYNEVFSPVVRHTSIRVILSLTACEDYELEQLNVKMAFLHAMGLAATAMIVAFTSRSLHQSKIEYTKGLLRKEFDMKERGPTRKILGMNIVRDRGSQTLKVPQSRYVQKNLNNYRVDNGKSVFVPLGAHFKGTADVGLVYGRDQGKHINVDGFMAADYAKTLTRYMALTEAVKESIWLKGLLIELGVNLRSVVVNCDNQSAIHLSRNAMFHERTKHINVRYHFIREIVESKEIEVAKIGIKG
ncbi:retrovirus-related pol polyprotein from transposon TNT 1-94 [Tanacetum coccineum]